jgi:hypothetical protein
MRGDTGVGIATEPCGWVSVAAPETDYGPTKAIIEGAQKGLRMLQSRRFDDEELFLVLTAFVMQEAIAYIILETETDSGYVRPPMSSDFSHLQK